MRIVFVGAVEEGWLTLRAVLERPEHRGDVAAIVTLADSEVEGVSGYRSFDDLGREFSVPVHKIRHIRHPESVELVRSLAPDLLMVIGWSQLVGEEVLRLAPLGCVGLHTTLLPRHRGRAPIPWALIKGLGRSGNTLFYFTPGTDNGDIIAQKAFYITLDDTAATVYGKAVRAGIDLVLENLPLLKAGRAPRRPQGEDSDHWPRRKPADGLIAWQRPALEVHDLIRGVSRPYPGAFTYHRGRKLIVWASRLLGAHELDLEVVPGLVLDQARYDDGLVIGTGDGALLIVEVQPEGEASMSALAYALRFGVAPGERLGQ